MEIWDNLRPSGDASPTGKTICSHQRHLGNDPENRTIEPRGEWNCARLRRNAHLGLVNIV